MFCAEYVAWGLGGHCMLLMGCAWASKVSVERTAGMMVLEGSVSGLASGFLGLLPDLW